MQFSGVLLLRKVDLVTEVRSFAFALRGCTRADPTPVTDGRTLSEVLGSGMSPTKGGRNGLNLPGIPTIQYHRDEPGSSERTSRNVEGGESPQRRYSRDSLSRDWGRGSPARRRVSSPVWDGYETKRRRYTADYTDHEYRQRRESLEKPRRPSPDSFSNNQKGTDFKYAASHDDDDFKYRRSPPNSWHRHSQDAYSKRSDDLRDRSFPGSYKDRDDQKRRETSQERRWSPDHSTKIQFKDKEHKDSPPAAECRQQQHRAGFSANRSSRKALQTEDATKSNEQKSSTGFQRFLEVLNKGVNVDVLTKIVTQISDQQPQQRTLSPSRSPVEKSLPKVDGSMGKASEPSVVEKVLTPEEEQKQRQMQGVLQAIGLDLGFEELGQMSSRIQERLYGKKDEDVTNERGTRQAFAPKRRSEETPEDEEGAGQEHGEISTIRSSDFKNLAMNPHDWSDSVQRLHPFSEAHHLRDAGSSERVPWSEAELDLHRERLCGSDPRKPSPPIQNRNEFEPGYPDGEPMVLEEEDPELQRRKKELQEIEERIMYKKAFIAVKTIGLLEKKSLDKQLNTDQGETLKERVTAILQRHPYSLIHKIQQPKERLKSPLLSEGDSLYEPHPLQLRVNSLLKHRRRQPVILSPSIEKTPDVPLPRHPLPADGNKKPERGFDRFLEVLNRGTDVNLEEILSAAPLPSAQLPSAQLPSAQLPSAQLPSAPLPSAQLPSASRSVTPPAKGASRSDEAFERFLKLLNNGTNVNFNEMVSSVPPPFSRLAHTSPVDSRRCDRPARNLNNAADSTILHQEVPALQHPSSSSSTNEESKVEKGFERFLSVLNKGVDINLLSKIVMDNKEEPSRALPSAERDKGEEPLGARAPVELLCQAASRPAVPNQRRQTQSRAVATQNRRDAENEGLKKQAGLHRPGRIAPTKKPAEPKPVLLTEEDIKANLRKKLQEFNEKAKQTKLVIPTAQLPEQEQS
ncbi:hypothetical protein OJAV_G00009750 [Oryzias javanicus]|uniref:Uncharacterized protein n=1 Tax=Oryzias javanicus TaxID=123683 RepID=A0A3S2PLB0_ORYJA|nr:hypothetical protein OJAV_G00009750 [Oryzias javanicus]